MCVDSVGNESLSPNPVRDGLYHISLPGYKKDPLWVKYMEKASTTAVKTMKDRSGDKGVILNSRRNLSIIFGRLRTNNGEQEDVLLRGCEEKITEFVAGPTLRNVADYIFADEHYNYHINDPEFRVNDLGGGNSSQTVCHYGTPRELEPAFDTPFQGEYAVNPYRAYAARAQKCRQEYSDKDGYMVTPLAKLKLRSRGHGYSYDRVDGVKSLRLTRTLNDGWWPTEISIADVVWKHINELFIDLTTLTNSGKGGLLDKKTSLIAQIGWWYFHLMPYTRGSAAIGNALLQSLFDFSGVKNSPYRDGGSPDLEAYVTPLPEYVSGFEKLFKERFTETM